MGLSDSIMIYPTLKMANHLSIMERYSNHHSEDISCIINYPKKGVIIETSANHLLMSRKLKKSTWFIFHILVDIQPHETFQPTKNG